MKRNILDINIASLLKSVAHLIQKIEQDPSCLFDTATAISLQFMLQSLEPYSQNTKTFDGQSADTDTPKKCYQKIVALNKIRELLSIPNLEFSLRDIGKDDASGIDYIKIFSHLAQNNKISFKRLSIVLPLDSGEKLALPFLLKRSQSVSIQGEAFDKLIQDEDLNALTLAFNLKDSDTLLTSVIAKNFSVAPSQLNAIKNIFNKPSLLSLKLIKVFYEPTANSSMFFSENALSPKKESLVHREKSGLFLLNKVLENSSRLQAISLEGYKFSQASISECAGIINTCGNLFLVNLMENTFTPSPDFTELEIATQKKPLKIHIKGHPFYSGFDNPLLKKYWFFLHLLDAAENKLNHQSNLSFFIRLFLHVFSNLETSYPAHSQEIFAKTLALLAQHSNSEMLLDVLINLKQSNQHDPTKKSILDRIESKMNESFLFSATIDPNINKIENDSNSTESSDSEKSERSSMPSEELRLLDKKEKELEKLVENLSRAERKQDIFDDAAIIREIPDFWDWFAPDEISNDQSLSNKK